MNDERNGRRLHLWRGKDREKDIAELTRAIAATGELFDHNGAIVRLEGGQLVGVNRDGWRAFIGQNFCGLRVVKNGTGWKREFYEYRFASPPPRQQPRPEDFGKAEAVVHEPDATVLDEIYRHRLLERLPKVER